MVFIRRDLAHLYVVSYITIRVYIGASDIAASIFSSTYHVNQLPACFHLFSKKSFFTRDTCEKSFRGKEK